jgi:uncharacterized protein YkwD
MIVDAGAPRVVPRRASPIRATHLSVRIAAAVVLVLTLTVATLLAAPIALSSALPHGSDATCSLHASTDAGAEARLLARVNAERQTAGLASVQLDRTFVGPIARWRSSDMLARRFFSHHVLPPDGPMFSTWLDRAGINYALAGETIGWTTWTDPARAENSVVDGFLASPEHRSILLGAAYTHVSIGVAGSCAGPVVLTGDEGSVGPVDRVEIITLIFTVKRGPNAPGLASAVPVPPAAARVTVTPDGSGTLAADIVDRAGRTVRWLTRGRHVTGSAALSWNGFDASGRRVHGTYRIRAWTVDEHGRSSPIGWVAVRV